MERKDRQPKPLIECEVPMSLHKEAGERTRGVVLSEEINEERIHLMKDWSRFAYVRHHNELWKQDTIQLTQQMALVELRKVRENNKIQICSNSVETRSLKPCTKMLSNLTLAFYQSVSRDL